MSSEWRTFSLGELGRIITGKTPSTARPDFFGGHIPFLTPTDMVDGQKTVQATRTLTDAGLSTVKNCLVPRGVAVSCIGWQMGKSVLVLEPTVTNQQINTLVVDESRFDLSYIYYLLANMRDRIFELGATPTRTPIVNKTTFSRIAVRIPGLDVQKEIAALGGMLDDRITLLRETNATLEAIAQALFKSWFVDFDPVHAKKQGRAPEGMDEATAWLFPDSFEDSELGVVPKGWCLGHFRSLVSESSDRVEKAEAVVLSAVQTGDLVRSDEHFNKRVHSADISRYKAVPYLSFAYNPSRINIGSIGLNEYDRIGAVSPVYVVAAASSPGNAYLIWHHLRTRRVKDLINILATGTVRQSLSFQDFGSIPVVIPPCAVLNAFCEVRASIYEKVRANSTLSETLATLRDTLLPRLISGQLRLPEANSAS